MPAGRQFNQAKGHHPCRSHKVASGSLVLRSRHSCKLCVIHFGGSSARTLRRTMPASPETRFRGSEAGAGRVFLEERFHGAEAERPDDVRTAYERDRSRVIHSAGFRRLQSKTQVMGVGEGDFHRTRLTHSIECAQVGTGLLDQLTRSDALSRELAEWMPPRPLVEAACFAHDLGHPPFGHGGEQALFRQMRAHGGFEGNAHTLRLLTRLEKAKEPDWGINPTRRLVLAVLKYPAAYSTFEYSDEEKFHWKPLKCRDRGDGRGASQRAPMGGVPADEHLRPARHELVQRRHGRRQDGDRDGIRMPDGSRVVMPFVDARGMAAATGLTSTVEDMARFVSAQFRTGARGDDRLLSTVAPTGGGAVGEVVRFVEENGEVVRMITGDSYADRVPE